MGTPARSRGGSWLRSAGMRAALLGGLRVAPHALLAGLLRASMTSHRKVKAAAHERPMRLAATRRERADVTTAARCESRAVRGEAETARLVPLACAQDAFSGGPPGATRARSASDTATRHSVSTCAARGGGTAAQAARRCSGALRRVACQQRRACALRPLALPACGGAAGRAAYVLRG